MAHAQVDQQHPAVGLCQGVGQVARHKGLAVALRRAGHEDGIHPDRAVARVQNPSKDSAEFVGRRGIGAVHGQGVQRGRVHHAVLGHVGNGGNHGDLRNERDVLGRTHRSIRLLANDARGHPQAQRTDQGQEEQFLAPAVVRTAQRGGGRGDQAHAGRGVALETQFGNLPVHVPQQVRGLVGLGLQSLHLGQLLGRVLHMLVVLGEQLLEVLDVPRGLLRLLLGHGQLLFQVRQRGSQDFAADFAFDARHAVSEAIDSLLLDFVLGGLWRQAGGQHGEFGLCKYKVLPHSAYSGIRAGSFFDLEGVHRLVRRLFLQGLDLSDFAFDLGCPVLGP